MYRLFPLVMCFICTACVVKQPYENRFWPVDPNKGGNLEIVDQGTVVIGPFSKEDIHYRSIYINHTTGEVKIVIDGVHAGSGIIETNLGQLADAGGYLGGQALRRPDNFNTRINNGNSSQGGSTTSESSSDAAGGAGGGGGSIGSGAITNTNTTSSSVDKGAVTNTNKVISNGGKSVIESDAVHVSNSNDNTAVSKPHTSVKTGVGVDVSATGGKAVSESEADAAARSSSGGHGH